MKHHHHIHLPRHFPHHLSCFLHIWKLSIILGLAALLCSVAALIHRCRARSAQISASEEGRDQPGSKRCSKTALFFLTLILGLFLAKEAALAAHGRLHLPIGHRHGHHGGSEWQDGYGEGDDHGDDAGNDDEGDEDDDAEADDNAWGGASEHDHAGKHKQGGELDQEDNDFSTDDDETQDARERNWREEGKPELIDDSERDGEDEVEGWEGDDRYDVAQDDGEEDDDRNEMEIEKVDT